MIDRRNDNPLKIKERILAIKLKNIFYALAIVLAVILIFQAGVMVGYLKASFSYKWGDNYFRAFGGGQERMREKMPQPLNGVPMPRGGFSDAHGVAGKIIKIILPTLVVQGLDSVEKIILVKEDTSIMKFRNSIKASELKVDDFITVIGSPDANSQIEAKLIRMMPSPPESIKK